MTPSISKSFDAALSMHSEGNVATCGRTVEIDMHAKGLDETMQNLAVATKMPVKISPKYWAEHMGPSRDAAATVS